MKYKMNFEKERANILQQLIDTNNFNFDELAIRIYFFQKKYNPIYKTYLELIGKSEFKPNSYLEIPFLPIDFFKKYPLKTGQWNEKMIFESSTTSSSIPSRHFVRDTDLYLWNIQQGFEKFYGSPTNYVFFGLLPSYLERTNSSLIFMVNQLIKLSGSKDGGFFLNDLKTLHTQIKNCQKRVFLIGVSFALLDFCEQYEIDLIDAIVMETGGMKGRRKELVRDELHAYFKNSLHISEVHSEYGMTELFSQAYSRKNGLFLPTDYFKVLPRDITDPMELGSYNSNAGLNFIDLINLDTISFIASEDLGRVYTDGTFEVLGRLDQSDIRGCNLMVS